MNPIEITLNRPRDNKAHLRADIRCQWTTLSLQGEHFITTIFWIPDGSPLQVRLRNIENLPAIVLIPITVRTEEFAILLVTLKIFKTLDKRENRSLDDLLDYMDKKLGRFNELSHINFLHPLVDIYCIIINCLWQHPATSNHLKITKIKWSEISNPIVLTAHSLRQLQPRNWKIHNIPRSEELTNLLSALQEFTKFPHFKKTHPQTRILVKKLIRQC